MKKIIHICFSESAEGCFKYALSKNYIVGDKIIGFIDDLSQGPIINLTLHERYEWWISLTKDNEICSEDIEVFKKIHNKFKKAISEIDTHDAIYLWYGDNSNDVCGIMYALEYLKNKYVYMYGINVSDIIKKNEHGIQMYRTPAEVMPKELAKFINVKKIISNEEKINLLNQWNLLRKENSNLRVLINKKVQSVNEDYFDINILKFTNKEFRKSARTIGEVLGNSEVLVGDAYIFWRVKELIKLGLLNFKGKFGVMREMEIKLSDKGLEYLKKDSEAFKLWEERINEELEEEV